MDRGQDVPGTIRILTTRRMGCMGIGTAAISGQGRKMAWRHDMQRREERWAWGEEYA